MSEPIVTIGQALKVGIAEKRSLMEKAGACDHSAAQEHLHAMLDRYPNILQDLKGRNPKDNIDTVRVEKARKMRTMLERFSNSPQPALKTVAQYQRLQFERRQITAWKIDVMYLYPEPIHVNSQREPLRYTAQCLLSFSPLEIAQITFPFVGNSKPDDIRRLEQLHQRWARTQNNTFLRWAERVPNDLRQFEQALNYNLVHHEAFRDDYNARVDSGEVEFEEFQNDSSTLLTRGSLINPLE